MRTLPFLALILLVSCQSTPKLKATYIDINQGKTKESTFPKNRDVLINKLGDYYKISYWHDYDGSLKPYFAYVGDTGLTKAAYSWLNDTTVGITMFNPDTDYKVRLEVSGNGSSSNLLFEEDYNTGKTKEASL